MSALPPVLRANSGSEPFYGFGHAWGASKSQSGRLMIVPCIMAHASQLIIDSILAVRTGPKAFEPTRPSKERSVSVCQHLIEAGR